MFDMIMVKRLGGARFALNADLIERIESAPDTILVMVDATRYIVEESVETVLELIREDRAQLLARVEVLAKQPPLEAQDEEPAPPVQLSLAGK